jgi:hypothetical protein
MRRTAHQHLIELFDRRFGLAPSLSRSLTRAEPYSTLANNSFVVAVGAILHDVEQAHFQQILIADRFS